MSGLSDEQGFPHRGTIQYVAPALDPQTGTLLVRGILANPDRIFLPGFFVRMRLPMGTVDRNALLVPDRALQTDQGGRYLLVLNNQDVVEQRYVQLGELMGALRVITSGLTPEDRVVVGDLWRATPGTKVTPQPTTIEAVTGSAGPGRSNDLEILYRTSGPRQCPGDRAGADRRDLRAAPAGRPIPERDAADGAGDDALSRRQPADRRRHRRPADRAAGQRRPGHDLHGVDQRL